MDYFADIRNTITLSQGLVRGRFGTNELQDQQYLNSNKTLERYGERTSDEHFQFNRNNTQLIFTHKFPKEGKEFKRGCKCELWKCKGQFQYSEYFLF